MEWMRLAAREFGVQYSEICIRTLSPEVKHIVPGAFYGEIFVPEEKNEVFYISSVGWKNFQKQLKKKYVGNDAAFEKLDKFFIDYNSFAIKLVNRIYKTNFRRETSKNLLNLYLEYRKSDLTYIAFDWVLWELNNLLANETKNLVVKRANDLGIDQEEMNTLYEVLVKPEGEASMYKLRGIAQKWSKLDNKKQKEIYLKYKWIPCIDYHYEPFSFAAFSRYMKNMKREKKVHLINFESALKRLKLKNDERSLVRRAKRIVYLKDFKDDEKRVRFCYAQTLYKEIGRRMKSSLKEVSFMTEKEIINFLSSGDVPKRGEIKDREENGFLLYQNRKNMICETRKIMKRGLKFLNFEIEKELSLEIKGDTASQGYAMGKVSIVKRLADINKVKKGDILVAISTVPDYLPAMERAAGIIAEEGGITSHAAIVSRELGIPCIVGAINATKILKDGQKVALDATNGKVDTLKD